MAKQRHELNTRILAVFFLVAMPFVAFGSFMVVSLAQASLERALGASFEQRAEETKLRVERYLADQGAHLRLLSVEPEVTSAVAPTARRRTTEASVDATWSALVASPLASRLKAITQVRPAFQQVQVVDVEGRVVAASSRGTRLSHDEAPWYKALAREGEARLGPWVSDVQVSSGAGPAWLELVYPIRDAADERWLGVVRAVVDAGDLYSVIAPVRIGRTGHAVLLRQSDGLVLSSDESERVLAQPYPGFETLQAKAGPLPTEALQIFSGRTEATTERQGYAVLPPVREKAPSARVLEPARLVGFSPIEVSAGVPWLAVVEQDLAEAEAPIRGVTRYLWIHFAGAFGSVLLLALYFSFKLEKPVIEEALHLHEEHVPAGAPSKAA